MNQKKLKQLRKLVADVAPMELQRPYTSTTIPTLNGAIQAQIPMTATYPKASRRRVYQDVKKVLNQAASHPDFKIHKTFRGVTLEAIAHAVI